MMESLPNQQRQGLYEPAFEHDNCGVGFIVNIKGRKSHEIVRNGIQILLNLCGKTKKIALMKFGVRKTIQILRKK